MPPLTKPPLPSLLAKQFFFFCLYAELILVKKFSLKFQINLQCATLGFMMNLILIRKVKVTDTITCSKFFGTIAVLLLVFEKEIIRKKGHYSSLTAVQLL